MSTSRKRSKEAGLDEAGGALAGAGLGMTGGAVAGNVGGSLAGAGGGALLGYILALLNKAGDMPAGQAATAGAAGGAALGGLAGTLGGAVLGGRSGYKIGKGMAEKSASADLWSRVRTKALHKARLGKEAGSKGKWEHTGAIAGAGVGAPAGMAAIGAAVGPRLVFTQLGYMADAAHATGPALKSLRRKSGLLRILGLAALAGGAVGGGLMGLRGGAALGKKLDD